MTEKKTTKLMQKRTDIKPIIENLQDKLYQLEKKQNMINIVISELYTDDNKLTHSSNPKDILKSEKEIYEKLYTKETSSKADSTELLSKISNRQKISN